MTGGVALFGLGLVIAFGKSGWPRWFALIANPVSLVLVGVAIARICPEQVSAWLNGAAFNLGWLVIYIVSTILLWKGTRLGLSGADVS